MKRDIPDLQIASETVAQPARGCAPEDNLYESSKALADLLGARDRAAQRAAVDRLVAETKREPGRHLDVLRGALESPNLRVRWAGAYAMAQIDVYDSRAAGALCEALSSRDRDRRWASVRMLARLGRKQPASVRRELAAMVRGDHPVARRMALYALREMRAQGGDIISLVEETVRASSAPERLAALALLASMDGCSDRAAEIAMALVQSDPDPGVRRAAAIALGKVGNRNEAIIVTLSRVAANDFDKSLARAAEYSLRRLGN